jgi:hypothetical protein
MLTYLEDTDIYQFWNGSAWTNLVSAGDEPGLVHVNTTDFTDVASQSVNNVFTSTYKNYKVIYKITAGGTGLGWRLRASGADNTTSNYANSFIYNSWNNTTVSAGTFGDTSLFSPTLATEAIREMDVIAPNLATQTSILGLYASNANTGLLNGQFRASTQFDGFTIISFGTNITGTIQVFGYKD